MTGLSLTKKERIHRTSKCMEVIIVFIVLRKKDYGVEVEQRSMIRNDLEGLKAVEMMMLPAPLEINPLSLHPFIPLAGGFF